jgi:Helix-turn-helix domain
MASTSPFGEHLKREREMRGVSLQEISSATRISTKFLEAIESGRWDRLPGGAFNRGFIRSTSRYLGLDEDGMVAEYALETKGNGTNHGVPGNPAESPRDWRRMAGAVGVIILVIAGGWFAVSKVVSRLRTHISAASTASMNPKDGSASDAAGNMIPLQLLIHASMPAHLRIMADGKSVFDGRIKVNEGERFGAHDAFDISTSDSAAIRIELNGHLVPTIGPAGRPGRITLTAKDVKSSAGGIH